MVPKISTNVDRNITNFLEKKNWTRELSANPIVNIWHNKESNQNVVVYNNIEKTPDLLDDFIKAMSNYYDIPYSKLHNELKPSSIIEGSLRFFGQGIKGNVIAMKKFSQAIAGYQSLFTATVQRKMYEMDERLGKVGRSLKKNQIEKYTELALVATAPGSFICKVEPTELDIYEHDENNPIKTGISATLDIIQCAANPEIQAQGVEELFKKYGPEVGQAVLKFFKSLYNNEMSLDLEWNDGNNILNARLTHPAAKQFSEMIIWQKLATIEKTLEGSIIILHSKSHRIGLELTPSQDEILIDTRDLSLEGYSIGETVQIVVDVTPLEKPTGEDKIKYEAKEIKRRKPSH